MNTAKIAKLCNEIEDVACDIARITMNDIVSAESRMIFDKAKEIAAEISTQSKTNADRIRQMSDEELAEMVSMKVCRIVKPDGKDCPKGFYFGKCDKCVISWLKQEVSEDAGTD